MSGPARILGALKHGRPMTTVVLALWIATSAAHLALAPSRGLRALYFPNPTWSGSATVHSIDRTISTREIARRWRFAAPGTFSVQWSGQLFIDTAGSYTFSLAADDGARLYVNRELVAASGVGVPEPRRAPIALGPGSHAVLLQHFQAGGAFTLEWSWSLDDGPFSRVPGWRLATRPLGSTALRAGRLVDALWWPLTLALLALAVAAGRRSRFWPSRPAAVDTVAPTGIRWSAAALTVFVVLALIHTWPLASDPGVLSRNDNADAQLNEWALAWVAHQLPRSPLTLFDANIFHPDRDALAYSEALIVQGVLAAPVAWLGGSPVLAHNLAVLAGMALTGWTMCLVIARWTGDRLAGLAAGALFAFNAHTLSRLPHVQAQHVEFLPLALLALDALLRNPRWAAAAWLALWFTLQSLASGYLLVMGAIALLVAVLARPEDWLGASRGLRLAPKAALAAVLAAIVLVPFLLPYARVRGTQGLVRSLDEVAVFSATWADYFSTPSRIDTWTGVSAGGATPLFPGFAAALLALAALASGTAIRDARARMCLAVGIVGVVLSFGPIVPGYAALYTAVPLLQGVRAAARFGYLGLVAVAVLAGFGLAYLRRRVAWRHGVKGPASALALALVVVEPLAAPIAYTRFQGIPAIYQTVAGLPDAVVAELPFPPPDAFYRNAPYVLNSTAHWRPVLNGYSGFVPPTYYRHFEALRSFPDDQAILALRSAGVTHVFVHLDRMPDDARRALASVRGLTKRATDGPIELFAVD
jgi:hypothetical protein